MRTPDRRFPAILPVFPVVLAASLLASAAAASAYSSEVVRCRDAVIKASSRHSTDMVRLLTDCHDGRLAGSVAPATDCNDIEAAAAALGEPFADDVFAADPDGPGGRCGGISPLQALYTSCPAPCQSIVVTDWASVDQCLACVTKARVEGFGSEAIGSSTVPPAPADAACLRSLLDVGVRIIPELLRFSQRCEGWVDRPNLCTDRDRYSTKIPKLRRKLSAAVSAKCKDADFSAIGGCPTALSDAACVLTAAMNGGEQLAYDAARMQDLILPMSPAGFAAITLGQSPCGLRTDGTLDCWDSDGGVEDYGRLGRFSKVSAQDEAICGLRSDGSIDCFSGGFEDFYGPGAPPAGAFSEISVGNYHGCALDVSGTATCWGNICDGATVPPPGTFAQISAGSCFTCGLRMDGSIECWGDNYAGQATAPAGTFTQVATGYGLACGLHQDGTVECWGDNYLGQTTPPPGTFLRLSDRVGPYYDICGIRPDSTIECWGAATPGDPPPAGTFVQLTSDGYGRHCAVRSDAAVECWGNGNDSVPPLPENGLQQISHQGYWYSYDNYSCDLRNDGSIVCRGGDDDFGPLDPPAGSFVHVSVGDRFGCALRSDGGVECWGKNDRGQALPPSGTFTQMDAGHDHACGVRPDSTIQCWGGSDGGKTSAPPGAFTQVSAGSTQSCGRDVAGGVECWGYSYHGQAPPEGSDGFQSIAAGGSPCAIRADGEVKCWGQGSPRGEFTQVSSNCGVRTDGSLDCWYPYWTPAGLFEHVDENGGRCALRRDGYKVCW